MRKLNDLTSKKFGKLTVISRAPNKKSWTMWNCSCECGKIITTYSTHLISGSITNCGCSHGRKGAHHVQWKGYGEISGRRWAGIQRTNSKGRKSRQHLEFTVTIEEAWSLFLEQNRTCALSGLPIFFGHSNDLETTASLDRIDSKKGYIPSNVQWVHKDINRMKNIFDQDYFIDVCRKIANFQHE